MNESTAEHGYTDPPPALNGSHGAQQPAAAAAVAAPPVPLLEGTFAIFVTPEESIVIAYRPRGADEDKRFIVPSFVVKMATSQSGQTPTEIFDALKEGM